MATVDSKLASEFVASPHYRKGRDHPLTRVTIHHAVMVGNARMVAAAFRGTRSASATYAIGTDGSIVQCVPEADTPWTSNSHDNDSRAITIEVANTSTKDPWPVGAETMEALIRLLVDICQRNPGIGRLRYTGDTTGNLTMHKWFFSTQCPGTYLAERFEQIATEVNKRLDAAKVPQVTTVYDMTASGLPEALAEQVAAELKSAGYSAALTAREVKQEQPVTPPKPEGYHSIAGEAVATAAQMVAYIKAKRPNVEQSVIDMISLYLTEGQTEGIAGDIAFAQSCVETGNFAFPPETCAVTLAQNNFAMMGVTSTFAKGESFATPQIGIRAQIQHLKAYANSEPLGGECVDPRFRLVSRGSAPYVEWLGQQENPKGKGWATAKGYGDRILAVLAEIRGAKVEEDKPAADTLAVGDVVTMQGGAPVYGRNREFASWVYSKKLYVRAIVGARVTVSIYKSGAITGNVHRKYLTKV
nr:MAG TPA: N-acetylmuramoyl-L-alanine amidase [Caudoviricetes sp.]